MGRSYRASREGCEKAEKASKLKGWTQEYLAGAASCTRHTVIKFFAKKPIEKRLFQAICNELDLEWGEIAELELEEEQSCRNSVMDTARENICEIALEDYSTTKVVTPPVSVVEKQNVNCNSEQLVITFTGDIETLQKNPNYVAGVLALMQAVSKDASLKIEKIELGSIKITFSGSPFGLKRLEELIKSGNLKEVEGMPVENVQLLTGVTIQEEQDKFRLVREIIAQGGKGRNLCDVNLSGANLRGADLSNADLSCADLSGTDLRNVNLSRSDLNCADLRGADLRGADLSGTYLHDAIIDSATRISNKWRLVWEILNQAPESRNLRGVNLYNANLEGANLYNANLEGAILYNANLEGANLEGANLKRANLEGANLEGANLYNANLEGAILYNAILYNANLEGANLYNAHLEGAILVGGILVRFIVERANPTGAHLARFILKGGIPVEPDDLEGARMEGANLEGANLEGARMEGANLEGTNLEGANLKRANLKRANLSNAILFSANLEGANLEGANLKRANLKRANLSNAILFSANLEGAILFGANLSNAILFGANLVGANLSDAIVENARFGFNKGLSQDMKVDLEKRGAIFEDSPGDRSGILTRS